MGSVDFPDMRLQSILILFFVSFSLCIPAFAQAADPAAKAAGTSPSFKKAERDATRMLNWWKHKLKKDPNFQSPPVSPRVTQMAAPAGAPLLQYSIEEETPPPAPKKKK